MWGLDLVGPLQKAPGGYTHLLVAIDKFSKWIEVRPLNSIRSEQAVAFFTNIIHRFGVPNSIITDNGTQFTGRKFLDFCEDHHIRVDWAAVAHPMTNGQVERANGMILQGTDEVQTPHSKRPGDGYCLQSLSGQVRLSRVELTPLAGAYNPSGVGHRGRPVETLSESVSNKGSRRCMMTASPQVYFL